MARPEDPDSADSPNKTEKPDEPGLRFDARLDYFLRLRPAEVVERVEAEAARLAEAEAALGRARKVLAETKTEARRKLAAEEVRRCTSARFRPFSSGIYVPSKRWGKPSIMKLFGEENVFSVLIDSEAACSEIGRFGVHVCSHSGDLTTALSTRSSLLALRRSGARGSVRLSRAWAPALGEVIGQAGIDLAQSPGPPAADCYGEGILIGVVDSWFDLHHPAFCSAPQTTRVTTYWDQTLSLGLVGSAPPALLPALPAPPGVEFSKADINTELRDTASDPATATSRGSAYKHVPCDPRSSTDGILEKGWDHGTYVLGAAAGNTVALPAIPRSATFKPGPGPAPKADLVLVRALTVSGSSALTDEGLVLAGVQYCFERGAAPGQPCVVNLSLCDELGGRDGLSSSEYFLDSLLQTPSRALTVASGNATLTNSHAHATVASDGTPTYLILTVGAGFSNPDTIEIWYDGAGDIGVEFGVGVFPAILSVVPRTALDATQSGAYSGAVITIENKLHARSGDNRVCVRFDMTTAPVLPADSYTLTLTATSELVNGEFHAWIDNNNTIRGWGPTHLDSSERTLSTPATAFLAISVGSHRKDNWPTELDTNSGRGGTRDGRVKPELAAAGMSVWVPMPRDRGTTGVEDYVRRDGTSIAAPIVAGACALLFQRGRSTAMCCDLREILIDLAHEPHPLSGSIAIPDKGWGWGGLFMGTDAVSRSPDVDVWLKDDPGDIGEEPFTGEVFWESPDIELLDEFGSPVDQARFALNKRFANRVRVTVRNRGTKKATNTMVFLYWGDPATNIPFPSEWRSWGIYVGGPPNFIDETNCIVVQDLAAGASTQVEFAWSAPMPGSGLAQDDHFCLLVRLENAVDPSGVGEGGVTSVVRSNNIAHLNVHVVAGTVQPAAAPSASLPPAPRQLPGSAWSESRFWIRGQGRREDLRIWTEGLSAPIELLVPVRVLPWGEIDVLAASDGRRPLGADWERDPLRSRSSSYKTDRAQDLARACGVLQLRLGGGVATITIAPGVRACLQELRLGRGSAVRAGIRVRAESLSAERGRVRVGQISDGRRVGGVTLELRRQG